MPVLQKLVMSAIAGLGAYGVVGGWAVITVVDPPDYLEAGSTYQVRYMVRQHGVTLLKGLDGSVVMQPGGSPAAATPITVQSQSGPTAGSYSATVKVPDTDRLTLSIRSGFSGNGWGDLTLMAIPVIRPGGARPALADADRGHRLFVAKGCGTCHVNGDVPEFAQLNKVVGEVGPALTGRRLEASYVRQRLTNPSSLPKLGDSPVRMPDLGLAPAEVTALVALLTAPGDRATQ